MIAIWDRCSLSYFPDFLAEQRSTGTAGTIRGTLLCYAYARTVVWCGSVTTRYRHVHAEREDALFNA
jgi:hypothetical protein